MININLQIASRPMSWLLQMRRVRLAVASLIVVLCGCVTHSTGEPTTAPTASPMAGKPRVALLVNTEGRHANDFDYALAALGWTADRYKAGDLAAMQALPGKLNDYDLLIVAPLFNFKNDAPLPGDARGAFLKWLENGGMIAVTDGSYGTVRGWLADIDPRFATPDAGKCNSSQWAINGYVTDAATPSPLRFFPSRLLEPNSWPHYHDLPAGSAWQLVAKCSEGHPVTFAQPVGKGLVTISALRQASARQLGNFYACLQLSRAGLTLKSADVPQPSFGDGKIQLEFANESAQEDVRFVYEVVPQTGEPQRFEKQVSGPHFELPYRVTVRGAVTARLLLRRGGEVATLSERTAEIPKLLTLTPPAYRGILSTQRRLPAARFGIHLAPDREDLQGATVSLVVLDADGNQLSAAAVPVPNDVAQPAWRQPIELDKKLPEGAYVVKATLLDGDKRQLAVADTSFQILAPRPAQTIVDEDGTFLVNGKPFFPMGLYHVKPEYFKDVAALGINTVQFWTWHTAMDEHGVSRGLAAASSHGLKALFELNHKSEKIFRDTVKMHGDNPAILMWYGLDEPTEGDYGKAATLRDTFNAEDPHHPVYLLSCVPDCFEEHSQFGNVFAVDPYGTTAKVDDWLAKGSKALEASGKPLICVPGAFEAMTPPEMRASAYLALAHNARGIIWYPWEQAGGGPQGIGCRNSPEQQAVIKEVCGEVKALLRSLTVPVRVPFASEDKKVRCIYLKGTAGALDAVLMVNSTPEVVETEIEMPAIDNLSKRNLKLTDYFKRVNWKERIVERELEPIEVKQGRMRVLLQPYETRAYHF